MATPAAAAPPRSSRALWLVPLVLLALGGVVWLLLAGLPFGGQEERPDREEAPRVETIAEGTAPPPSTPRETGTVIDVGDDTTTAITEIEPNVSPQPPASTATTATTATIATPPVTKAPVTTPPVTKAPVTKAPVRTPPAKTPPPVRREPTPPPVQREREPEPAGTPAPAPPRDGRPSGQISAAQGSALVRSYITSRNYYDVPANCIRIEGGSFRNRGYAFEAWSSCGQGGASRLLGRWRIDSLTREIFRQYDDGRYLRP